MVHIGNWLLRTWRTRERRGVREKGNRVSVHVSHFNITMTNHESARDWLYNIYASPRDVINPAPEIRNHLVELDR